MTCCACQRCCRYMKLKCNRNTSQNYIYYTLKFLFKIVLYKFAMIVQLSFISGCTVLMHMKNQKKDAYCLFTASPHHATFLLTLGCNNSWTKFSCPQRVVHLCNRFFDKNEACCCPGSVCRKVQTGWTIAIGCCCCYNTVTNFMWNLGLHKHLQCRLRPVKEWN